MVTSKKTLEKPLMVYFARSGDWCLSVRRVNPIACRRLKRLFLLALVSGYLTLPMAYAQKKDDKKDDKKKPTETLKVERVTQGMGLYAIGPLSPDRKSVLLLAQKPNQAPNLYVMNVTDRSIRPQVTSFRWGATDPAWSPD